MPVTQIQAFSQTSAELSLCAETLMPGGGRVSMLPKDQTRDVKETPEIHIPFHNGKVKRRLPDQQKLGKLEAANIHQKRLFTFSGGADSSDLMSPSYTGRANFFSMANIWLSPTGPVHRPTKRSTGQVTIGQFSPLGEAWLEGGHVASAASVPPGPYHSGQAARAEDEGKGGVDRKRSGEEPQEYEAKLQTTFC